MEGATTYPQVFVVDSQAGGHLPPSPAPWWTRKLAWRLLFLLLVLAILGVLVEACFIYQLYQRSLPQENSAFSSALQGAADSEGNEIKVLPTKIPHQSERSPRPSAHLTVHMESGVLTWGVFGEAFIREMGTSNGQLLVQREGYYYIYSKVLFKEPKCSLFRHVVVRDTPRYPSPIELMKAKRSRCHSWHESEMLSSYLGGTFHLYENDILSVKLDNNTLLRHQETSDNFFGAFMI